MFTRKPNLKYFFFGGEGGGARLSDLSRSFFNLKPLSVIVYKFQIVRFIQMMSLTFGLFTQVSGSGPLGTLVYKETKSKIFFSGGGGVGGR